MSNTIVYREEWKTKLQEKLDEPKYWDKVATVTYTDKKVINNPYQNVATADAYTRGNQYTYNDVTLTNETLNINTSYVSPEFIDRAELAQSGFDLQMERAERQAQALLDQVETAVLAEYANAGLDLDNTDLGGGAGDITVSVSNIDDIFRLARKEIVENKGLAQLKAKGGFAILDPEKYELAVAYAQANGFRFADDALVGGEVPVINGFRVYESNLLTTETSTTHLLFGVNGAIDLGILNTTFGDIMVDENDPDNRSGVSIVSRVDYGTKVFTEKANLLVDVQVVD
jgi:hypothetical protein